MDIRSQSQFCRHPLRARCAPLPSWGEDLANIERQLRDGLEACRSI